MKLALSPFARTGIEACLGDLEAGVEAALRYYAQTRARHPQPAAVAQLFAEQPAPPTGDELELNLDPEIERALASEAQRTGRVSVGQLGTHAVLVYLADLDRSSAEVLQTPARS
jgi:hypothetical protein